MVTKMMIKNSPTLAANYRFPKQGEWRYEDWLKFPSDGWKYEIINGALYMTPPPAINHQRVSGKLFRIIANYVEENSLGEVLEAPCGVRLPGQPVPVEPDIFFIKQERLEIIDTQQVEGSPDLIIEILSPSNAHYDRKIKFDLYQSAGVPEYWLVDYQKKTITIYNLIDGNYSLTGSYRADEMANSTQLAGFSIAAGSIFNF